jgi:hypothetical protein
VFCYITSYITGYKTSYLSKKLGKVIHNAFLFRSSLLRSLSVFNNLIKSFIMLCVHVILAPFPLNILLHFIQVCQKSTNTIVGYVVIFDVQQSILLMVIHLLLYFFFLHHSRDFLQNFLLPCHGECSAVL